MKRIFFFLFPIFLLCTHVDAAELETNSKVTAVTVYRNLARETRSSITNLPAGNTEVVISNVSLHMLDPSIQVAVKGGAVLLSASVRTNSFNDDFAIAANPAALRLQDSITALKLVLRWIAEERSVHVGELQLIAQLLQSATTQKEYKPTDLNACADIYRSRTMELRKKLFDMQLRQEAIEARVAKHQDGIEAMAPKTKNPVKEIVLSFWAEAPVTATIKTMYLVNSAGWTPMYDLNVANTSQPIAISYKASVFQSTGYDWKSVDLTISTSTPGMNNDRPILSPRYVDFVTYAPTSTFLSGAATNSMNISIGSTVTNEAEVPQYEVSTTESDIHVDYKIEIDQTIASDGNQHICKLKNYDVPATYRYHTVPKLDLGVFLLARITDYGQYNLLAGQANVFFEDAYIGQVALNPQVTGDTLLVSLGRDEKIVVKRTRIQEKTGKKFLEGKETENFAYKITVRNNKGVPIRIEVLDQVPMSRTKDIVVELEEMSGADYQKDYGRLLWQLKVDPNKSKTLDLSYKITSPTGKIVAER
jgi:uncharacterized protein (TIGR02231 family)